MAKPVNSHLRLFSIFLFLLNGCATTHPGSSLPKLAQTETNRANPGENKDYKELEELFTRNQSSTLEQKATSFSSQYPNSSLLPSVENLLGLQNLRDRKSELAVKHFLKALELNPDYSAPFNQYILYNLASAYADTHQLEESTQTLDKINLELLDKGNRIKVHYLKANIFENKGIPLESARQLLTASQWLSDLENQDNRSSFDTLLNRSLQKIHEVSLLEKLYQEFEDSPTADTVLFQLGSLEVHDGSHTSGEAHLKLLLTRFPRSNYYIQAQDALKQLKRIEPIEPRFIGVLLPMNGKFAKFGARSLQGIELALGVFNSDEPDSQLTLVIEDSGENPKQAIQALDRLFYKHHVIAVIGPMLAKGIEEVSQHAQELGIPLLSLARSVSSGQDFVFQAGLTQQLQAYEMARHAIQELGLHDFAIACPEDKLGTAICNSFWDAVDSFGGKVVGYETYPNGQTDFRQVVDKLSGLYYKDARQRELNLLSEERLTNHIKKATRKTAKFFNLPPIVDYQAVFVPDEPKVSGQILPTFAYRDVENVQFLGTSAWNSPDFLSRIQGEPVYFVDAFFLESDSNHVKNFISKYKATFGQVPSALEALAYDSALVLRNSLAALSNSASRSDVRDQLKQIRNFQGVTGTISYKDGHLARSLMLLQVKNGKFAEATK